MTVIKWLETLPEPYRTEALANIKSSKSSSDAAFYAWEPSNLSSAISGSLIWSYTPQGFSYWLAVSVWGEGGGELPPPSSRPLIPGIPQKSAEYLGAS